MIRVEESDHHLLFTADDGPVASYRYDSRWRRPFFLPVCGPGGVPVTRGWPVEPASGDTEDHVHHKGVWVAHGDINGVDNWGDGDGCGRIVHEAFDRIDPGPDAAGFTEYLRWTDDAGAPVLREQRRARWRVEDDGVRILDLDLEFSTAGGDPVVFGDTKEGGLLSVRVATSMDAGRDGRIENADGLAFERGDGPETTWGRRSRWVDYSGPAHGEQFGIAILDHPGNPVHPTWWHVRGYGLFTANPFGVSFFEPDAGQRGDLALDPGRVLRFRYRMIVHRGAVADAAVEARWRAYAGE